MINFIQMSVSVCRDTYNKVMSRKGKRRKLSEVVNRDLTRYYDLLESVEIADWIVIAAADILRDEHAWTPAQIRQALTEGDSTSDRLFASLEDCDDLTILAIEDRATRSNA